MGRRTADTEAGCRTMGCSKIKEKLNCCKRESLKEKSRKYHLSYKAKEEEVSLVEGQKEAYKVPQEYGVAKYDPVSFSGWPKSWRGSDQETRMDDGSGR